MKYLYLKAWLSPWQMNNSNYMSPNSESHELYRMKRLIAHKSYEKYYICAIREAELQWKPHGIFKMFDEY